MPLIVGSDGRVTEGPIPEGETAKVVSLQDGTLVEVWIQNNPPSSGGGDYPGGSTIYESGSSLTASATYAETLVTQVEDYLVQMSAAYAETNVTPNETNDFIAYIDGGNETNPAQTLTDSLNLSFADETNNTPTEVHTQSLDYTAAPELNPAPDETHAQDLSLLYTETVVAQTETHAQDLTATYDETNNTPDEDATQSLAGTYAETNPAPVETGSVDIAAAPETNVLPTMGAHTLSSRIGAASVVASAPQSGGQFQTPNNSIGLQDAVYTSVVTAAGLSTSTKGGTLDWTFPAVGTLATETQNTATVTLNAYGSMAVGSLATGSLAFYFSTNSGGSYTQLGTTLTTTLNFNTVPLSNTVTLNIGTQLSTFRIRAIGSVTNSVTGAVNIYLDAVELVVTHTGAAG